MLRRERVTGASQRFKLPWHAFRLGLAGQFAAGSTMKLGDGTALPLPPNAGSAAFYPAHTTIANEISAASRLTYMTVEIDPMLAERLGTDGTELTPLALIDDPLILSLLNALEQVAGEPDASQRLFAEQAAVLLLLAADRHRSGSQRDRGGTRPGGLGSFALRLVTQCLADRLADTVSLTEIAGLTGLSPAHVCRAFKVSTGMTPHRWQLTARVERAKGLLSDPSMPLAQVALAVGFAAQPQFTTAFRRETGMTSGAWRRDRVR